MFLSFPENLSICQVLSLNEYLADILPLGHTDDRNLFLSLIKPYKCVTSQTLARWILQLMADAGIDTDIFKQHSTCNALGRPWGCMWPRSARLPLGQPNPPLFGYSIK